MPPSETASRPPSILRQESSESGQYAASPKSYAPSQDKATPKSVSYAPSTEIISPLLLGNQKDCDELDLDQGQKPKRSSLVRKTSSKRLAGRLPFNAPSPSLNQMNAPESESDSSHRPSGGHKSGHHLEHLIDQVQHWIKAEREKHAERKAKRHPSRQSNEDVEENEPAGESTDSFDLDQLQSIIESNLKSERRSRFSRHRSPDAVRHKGSLARLRKASSASDTESLQTEIQVPSCDAVLDNSKTLSYTGGGASDDSATSSADELERTVSYREMEPWALFKFEVVRLIHTLRLKGWRRVPMERSNEVTIKRLSGALTNAVYEVSPPSDLPSRDKENKSNGHAPASKRPPPKLLLRIYGSQVDHLIDRDSELAILRRLARKRIGPRLLGTFANGRFEEYLNAKPLTPEDLRNPDTSRQIAKRMRELHDGIELEMREREAGPFVWQNWDKWVDRVEQIVSWLDCQIAKLPPGAKPTGQEAWKRRGYICGVPWKQFRSMVDKYRKWLNSKYGGRRHIREQLVFSHNDTQYGNILRLQPTGESPLLLPMNTHKQLVVIDFEYANANLPGLEFANHFTEWCYNYHDARKPYAFHPKWYPNPEEQERFVRAYVRHRPQFNVSTPKLGPSTPNQSMSNSIDSLSRRPTSTISEFMADARTPQGAPPTPTTEDAAHKANEDREVSHLVDETKLWRLANTAMWVAWGIIQAKVPGMPKFDEKPAMNADDIAREELGERGEEYRELAELQQQVTENATVCEEEKVEDEFDYLGYSQHRALFFWGDAIQMGFVKAEELPEELRGKVKSVPY